MTFNLLFVSIAFPPKNDPECLQTARYFKYLSQQPDWNIDIVTSKSPTLFMPFDKALQKYDHGYRQKVELSVPESKASNFILRKFGFEKLLFPDSKMTFHWQWRKAVRLIKMRPDILYSRSKPMSSALMAFKLKEYYKCRWIMHISDPWAISPMKDIPPRQVKKYLEKERMLLQSADVVTFTTSKTMGLYARVYPTLSSKFSVSPNVYDSDDIQTTEQPKSNNFRIVYTGGLAAKRNVFFLKEVLDAAYKTDPEALRKVEFIFAGDMDKESRQFFSTSSQCMKHVGLLSYSEVKKLCLTAQILLVVDNPTAASDAVYFPSKILDYFLTRRKIWAITPPDSATREILRGYNHEAFGHDEIITMATSLLKNVRLFEEYGNAPFQSEDIPSRFEAKTNAADLSRLILNQLTR